MRIMSCFCLRFGFALLGLVSGDFVLAQTSWVQRFPVNAPGGRALHVVTSVYGEGRVLMHGGRRPGSSAIYSDLWQWSGGGWTQLPTNNVLLPRWGHAMAYDVARQKLVCFGGNAGSATQPNAETWLWDGQSWFQVSASGPVARSEHAMVYDSVRQRCVMFGGVSTTSFLGDTWDWDGSAWLPRFGPVNPSPRGSHGMAYDADRRRVVLFGGRMPGGYNDETWEFDGNAWLRVVASGPVAREQMAMSYDAQWKRVVMFGGYAAGSSVMNDTWTWSGASWIAHQTANSATARGGVCMAYDDAEAVSVIFGGAFLGDTWTLEGTAASARPFGVGCGSQPLVLDVAAQQLPLVGGVAGLSASSSPVGFAFLAIGTSRSLYSGFPLPLSLSSLGMDGCNILQSNDVESALFMPQASPGAAGLQIAIPNVPAFVGVHLYLQAWTGAPGVNAAGFIVSNGLDWKIGNT